MPHLVIGKKYRNMDDIMRTFSFPFPAEKGVTKRSILCYILSRANGPKNGPFSHPVFSIFSAGKKLLLTQCHNHSLRVTNSAVYPRHAARPSSPQDHLCTVHPACSVLRYSCTWTSCRAHRLIIAFRDEVTGTLLVCIITRRFYQHLPELFNGLRPIQSTGNIRLLIFTFNFEERI